jgi:hypothetical protein
MAWTTPKTWTATTSSTTELNTHVRDNLNAVRDSQKITVATASADVTFSNVETDLVSTSYTYSSSGIYIAQLAWYGVTPTDNASYAMTARIRVNGNEVGATRFKIDATTTTQGGGIVLGYISGVSGALTTKGTMVASAGSGHTVEAASTFRIILTIRPVDVV